MTAPLRPDTTSINAEAFLRAWLLPIITTTPPGAAIGSKMWTTSSPKPYRVVRRISGPQTIDYDESLLWVHTFGPDYDSAAQAALATDARVRVLVEYPGYATTLSNGRVVRCDWAEIVSAAHWEEYSASSVVERFVSEYRFGLSFVPA